MGEHTKGQVGHEYFQTPIRAAWPSEIWPDAKNPVTDDHLELIDVHDQPIAFFARWSDKSIPVAAADFIVKAVNQREELVGALGDTIRPGCAYAKVADGWRDCGKCADCRARALLAKIGGGK